MKLKPIVWLIFCLQISNSMFCQEIVPFKDRMPLEKYEELTEAEAEANEEKDAFLKAGKFEILAGQSTRLSEDLGIIFFEKAMEAALASNSDSMIAAINMHSCIPFINKDLYDEAGARIDKAIKYFEESRDTTPLAMCYSHLGYLERVKGSNYLALKNVYKAKTLRESQVPLFEMWAIINSLIINYDQLKDYESGIAVGDEYLESAKHLEQKPRGYHTILRNTGEMRLKNGEVENAKPYIEEALAVWMKERIPKFMVSSYSLLHDLALAEGDLTQAKIFADSSLYYSNQFDALLLQSQAHLRVYKLLNQQDQADEMEYHLHRSLNLAIESKHKTSILEAARAASIYEAEDKDYKSAYNLLHLADSIRSELYPEETINSIKKFEKQIIHEESQQEIDLLESQNEVTQLRLSASKRRGVVFGLGLLGFAGFSFWLFQLYRRIQSQNTIISKALNEKETLLKEIHHRVKNNLQFISSLLRLQTGHVKDAAALDVLHEGQDRVQSMALIHQNLYQEDNLTGVDMRAYFNKLNDGLFNSYNIHDDRIQLELDIADVNLDVDTVIPLGLIVNELISNSLKYASPDDRSGKIKVSLDRQEETLLLRVEDNGGGISPAGGVKMTSSFGYKLIMAFTRQLEAEMTTDASEGTKVEFEINNFELSN